jgi:phosphatidylinositol alpha-1,6-mannosyltransferase
MLALVTDAFGGRGGIAQYNRDFLSALVLSGTISSIAVLPRNVPDPVSLLVGIAQAPARSDRVAYSLGAIWSALFTRFDVIFCGHIYMVTLAALLSMLKGAKSVVQAHGIEVWHKPSGLRRAALERADLVLCVSRSTRAAILNWAAIAPERVVVLPNTVGDSFRPGAANKRKELDLEDRLVLLTVGRIDSRERYKGHDSVVALLPSLVANGLDVVYLVVGEGDDRPRLEAIVRETGLDSRVRFLGAIALEDLAAIYRSADLFVMPSTSEGFGIAFLEAMASGIAAIGFNVAGARDALADGELGIVTTPSDLSASLRRILESPKPDPWRLANAVRARFGRNVFAAQVSAVFSELLWAA